MNSIERPHEDPDNLREFEGSTLCAAQTYVKRGWCPIPLPYGKKGPCLKGWPDFRIPPDEIAKHFAGSNENVGVLLGEPSGGLVDVDLDSPQTLRIADMCLPATSCIFGRQSKPRSHFLYLCETSPKTTQFGDLDGSMLVEVRSTGMQTMFP